MKIPLRFWTMLPTFSSRTVEVASNFLRASSSAKNIGAIPYYDLGAQPPPPSFSLFFGPYIKISKT